MNLDGIKIDDVVVLNLSNGMLSDPMTKSGYVEKITDDEIIISNSIHFREGVGILRRATPKIEWRIPKENIIYYRIVEYDRKNES